MPKRTKPNAKEWTFIKSYAINFNATEAYLEAMDNDPSITRNAARVAGHRMLHNPLVQEHLSAYVQEILGPQEKTLLGNVKFWLEVRDSTSNMAIVDLEDVIELLAEFDMTEDDVKEKLKDKVKFLPTHKTADRMKASEYLGRYANMFVDKKDISVEAAVTIVDDIPKKGK